MSRHVYQPLHPAVRPRLDPQYVAFHDAHMQYVQPDDQKVWDGSARTTPSLPKGTSDPVDVAKTEDLEIDKTFTIRVFAPKGTPPSPQGWPLFVWYHGGGWAIGGVESENDFCTRICADAQVVVATVGYRLAPEHPFPTAADDAATALLHLTKPDVAASLQVDRRRVAVGGTSAGANLSLVAALRYAEEIEKRKDSKDEKGGKDENDTKQNLRLQLLIVPVVDNTAVADSVWARNAETAPWLTPKRMLWYRAMYLPDQTQWSDWHASPNKAPEALLRRLPPTWITVSAEDVLAPEGEALAAQLKRLGVETELHVLPGCTHSILALNGIMDKGAKLVEDAVEAVKKAFR